MLRQLRKTLPQRQGPLREGAPPNGGGGVCKCRISIKLDQPPASRIPFNRSPNPRKIIPPSMESSILGGVAFSIEYYGK